MGATGKKMSFFKPPHSPDTKVCFRAPFKACFTSRIFISTRKKKEIKRKAEGPSFSARRNKLNLNTDLVLITKDFPRESNISFSVLEFN
jgi:hypothetical protein